MYTGPASLCHTMLLSKPSPSFSFFKLIFMVTANPTADRELHRPRSLLGLCSNLLFRLLDLWESRDPLQSQDSVFVPDLYRIRILTFLFPSSFQHLMILQPESSTQLWFHRSQHLTQPFGFCPFWANCWGQNWIYWHQREILLGSTGPTYKIQSLSLYLGLWPWAQIPYLQNGDYCICSVYTQVLRIDQI